MPNATITYHLTDAGQRAALAAGKNAEWSQSIIIEVPTDALDLFEVRYDGALQSRSLDGGADAPFDPQTDAADILSRLRAQDAAKREREQQRKAEEERQAAELRAKAIAIIAGDDRNTLADVRCEPDRVVVFGGYTGGVYTPSVTLRADDADPAVAERVREFIAAHDAAVAARVAEESAKAAQQKLLDSLPPTPVIRTAELQPDGRYAFEVPTHAGQDWAKRLDSVDPAQSNGMAFEGPWLKTGTQTVLALGDIVVGGGKEWSGSRKHGEWKKTRDTYVVTPAGLYLAKDNTPVTASNLLAMDPAERIEAVLTRRVEVCDRQLAAIAALDMAEYADVADEVAARRAAWETERARIQAALEQENAEPALTELSTVDSAAALIVAAGYKALAAVHHPDKGGDTATMALINEARAQLRELLALAGKAAQ